MKLKSKVILSVIGVAALAIVPTSIALTATSCGSSSSSSGSSQIAPVKFNDKAITNSILEAIGYKSTSEIDADLMVEKVNDKNLNKVIVEKLKANANNEFANVSTKLSQANIQVVATKDAENNSVNVQISNVWNKDNKPVSHTLTITGFRTPTAVVPEGFMINNWELGDQFDKNGCTYEVMMNPKRYDWENQPKYALKVVRADLDTIQLDHLADDNATGKVFYNDAVKGDVCLPLLALDNNSISTVPWGAGGTVTIGTNEPINIVLPSTLVSVGDAVFYRITNPVNKLQLNDNLEKVGKSTFQDINYTGPLVLPKELEWTDLGSFSAGNWTGDLVIPNKMKSISDSCFSWCLKLNKVIFNNTLERIEESAFYATPLKENIFIPNSVNFIGNLAFRGCLYPPKIVVSYPATAEIDLAKQESSYTWEER